MAVDRKISRDDSTKQFLILLLIIFGIFLLLSTTLIRYFNKNNIIFYKTIFLVVAILVIVIGIMLLLTIFAITMLYFNKDIPHIMKVIMKYFMIISQPFVMELGKIIKFNKNSIRRAYTNLNNQIILSEKYEFNGEDILVLSPHCLQKDFCPHKITNDIYNCKRCGKCDVDKLIDLREKYGINFSLVTGGTLARKVIVELRPKAIVAIACERDLLSGLMDVSKIPILAIINERPQGPCINTQVDIRRVEKAILHFIKE